MRESMTFYGGDYLGTAELLGQTPLSGMVVAWQVDDMAGDDGTIARGTAIGAQVAQWEMSSAAQRHRRRVGAP